MSRAIFARNLELNIDDKEYRRIPGHTLVYLDDSSIPNPRLFPMTAVDAVVLGYVDARGFQRIQARFMFSNGWGLDLPNTGWCRNQLVELMQYGGDR